MDTFATIRCPVASGCFALAARVARSETDVSSCANGDRQTDRQTDRCTSPSLKSRLPRTLGTAWWNIVQHWVVRSN